jgi:nicotinamide mononucleotide transporter PnuC
MEIMGIFKWSKNIQSDTKEIRKTSLINGLGVERGEIVGKIIYSNITKVLLVLLGGFIWWINQVEVFDGVILLFSVLGMYLTVRRCIEQWLAWTIVNVVSIMMWIRFFIKGSSSISTIVVWGVYLVLGIYFYYSWRDELKQN